MEKIYLSSNKTGRVNPEIYVKQESGLYILNSRGILRVHSSCPEDIGSVVRADILSYDNLLEITPIQTLIDPFERKPFLAFHDDITTTIHNSGKNHIRFSLKAKNHDYLLDQPNPIKEVHYHLNFTPKRVPINHQK